LEASKLTFAYVFSLWTGENVVRTFFEWILLHSPFLVTASEESFLKNMLMLAWCHENPGMLCLVCTVTLVVFGHTVVFTTIHSTTFKEITVGSASFFKYTANSWYHTDLFKNNKGAIVTHKETQARACIFLRLPGVFFVHVAREEHVCIRSDMERALSHCLGAGRGFVHNGVLYDWGGIDIELCAR